MNYASHYQRLVERARRRVIHGYTEKHHVVPKCMGGGNGLGNVVSLTPEEHYVAHQLLVKMHPKNHLLLWAASAMTGKTQRMKRNNKLHGWLRRRLSEATRLRATGRKHTEESKAKMSASRRGVSVSHSAETRKKISAAHAGVAKSEAHKAALSKAKLGTKRAPHSAETKARIAASNRAAVRNDQYKKAPEYRAHQSALMREIWAQRKQQTQGI